MVHLCATCLSAECTTHWKVTFIIKRWLGIRVWIAALVDLLRKLRLLMQLLQAVALFLLLWKVVKSQRPLLAAASCCGGWVWWLWG